MDEPIIVDFSAPMPVFPLPGVVLLPHAVRPLHIFEPRYRQMVVDGMEDARSRGPGQGGQIALACLSSGGESPAPVCLRPVACVGRIVEHTARKDGLADIRVQGLCRARITGVHEPDGERLYHLVDLTPLEPASQPMPALPGLREQLRQLLAGERLSRMQSARALMFWLDQDEVPVHALVELVAHELIENDDRRYEVLAESDPRCRARLVRAELRRLDRLIADADRQSWRDWPKGVSWN